MASSAFQATRSTAQKEAIAQALEAESGFVSAQQLYQRMHDAGTPVGLATVYRQLNALAAAGQADTITVPSGQIYRSCVANGHHHHLVCEGCGIAVEVDPPNEDWFAAIARTHGFTVTSHVLEVFGLCADCAANGYEP